MLIISYKFCLKTLTLMIPIELDHNNIICAQTRCLGRISKADERNTIRKREFTGWPPCHPWGDYEEELSPFASWGRRFETGSGWKHMLCETKKHMVLTSEEGSGWEKGREEFMQRAV